MCIPGPLCLHGQAAHPPQTGQSSDNEGTQGLQIRLEAGSDSPWPGSEVGVLIQAALDVSYFRAQQDA